jgi:hypothetical protein
MSVGWSNFFGVLGQGGEISGLVTYKYMTWRQHVSFAEQARCKIIGAPKIKYKMTPIPSLSKRRSVMRSDCAIVL